MEEKKVEEKKKEKRNMKEKEGKQEKRLENKRRIAVIFGGCSPEYGVSLESAYSVICHLDREHYQPVPVGISRTGSWFYFTGETEKIKEDTWCNEADCIPALLSPDRGRKGLWLLQTEPVLLPIDAAFPVLHGKNGEDGTVQGLIELAGLPLIGCGVLASALCMDKARAHRLAQLAGVRVPKAMVLERTCWDGTEGQSHIDRQGSTERQNRMERQGSIERQDSIDKQDSIRRLQEFTAELGYPLYVKPVKAGSSFGVTKVLQPDKLEEAIDQAFAYDSQVIIEENIEGFEVGCAVLGREDLIVGEVDEIELQEGFFNFTEKYTLQTAAIHVPARISAGKAEEIKEAAKRIYRALDCSGFARVDLFLTPEGDIVFNEVNTIPGFTEHSRYPGMMKAAGYSMEELLELLCEGGGRS